jgi:hypothetical protein
MPRRMQQTCPDHRESLTVKAPPRVRHQESFHEQ